MSQQCGKQQKQFAAQGSYNKRHEFFAKHKTSSPLSFERLRGFINIHPKSIDQSFLRPLEFYKSAFKGYFTRQFVTIKVDI